MRKKILSTCLVMALAVSSLAGCGSKTTEESKVSNESSAQNTASSGSTAVESEVPEEEIPTLVWLMFGNEPADNDSVMEKVNEITIPAIGAKLDIQYIDAGAYNDRMTMNMASGSEDYDLCFTGYMNSYTNAAVNGGLLDLTDYIEEMPELKNSVPDYFWNGAYIDGRIYAVPNQQIVGLSTSLNIKKDVADEYGLDINEIEYMEDLEPFFEWLKEKHPEMYCFQTNANNIGNYEGRIQKLEMYSSVCYGLEDGEYVIKPSIDFEDFETWPRLMNDWYKKGYIRKDVASAGNAESEDRKAGKYAVWMGSYKPGNAAALTASLGYEVLSVPMTELLLGGAIGTSTMIGVNRTSLNPEKAVKFIELINTNKELYNLICFGIEDKHYTMENGKVVADPSQGYALGADAWKYGNQFNALVMEGQEDTIWEDTKKYIDEGIALDTIGFVWDRTACETEYAQVRQVKDKYIMLWHGAVDDIDKSIKDFKDELKAAGIDKMIADINEQFKEFQANKK